MKILKILYYVVLGFIGVIAVLLIISVLPITGNIKFMTVLSGSMEPAIKTGSVVMTRPHSTSSGQASYNVGDIITFGPYSKTKPPTTHRIVEVKKANELISYLTKGDANNAPDAREVSQKDVIGKVMFDVPYFGYVVAFARKPIGFLLILIVPALAIVFDEIKKIFGEVKRLKKSKIKDQSAK
jgi:signal peptidase